jgi:hypothetical protein
MGIISFGLGQTCPIPAYGPVIYIVDSGPVLLWPSPRMSEADELQRGQLTFGFEEDGIVLHFGVRSAYLGAAGLVSFDAPLLPLPNDDKEVTYMCLLVGVDTETQKVKALRQFAFSREIGDLFWRMSLSSSKEWFLAHQAEINKHLPTEQELFDPSSVIWILKQRVSGVSD